MSIITDNKVLVHIYSGLESKNKVTLGLLVALTAEKNDHKVTLFLAGDGVQILNCKKERGVSSKRFIKKQLMKIDFI